MEAPRRDWLSFGTIFAGSVLAIALLVFVLNFSGDCAPEVPDCGQSEHQASLIVLGIGAAWLLFLIVRFVRSPGKS